VKLDLKAIRARLGDRHALAVNLRDDGLALCDRVEELERALLRLADTWDRLGPPTTATLSGRPTAIQQARALLAHQPPPSERPMHVGGSAATQDGIADEPSDGYALCVNHQTPRDDCPMCSPTETREACATCGGSGQIWMTTGGAADCYDCGGSGRAR
jgi:hypothetical protein